MGATITPVEALVELARSAREDPLEVVLNTVAKTVHRVAGYRSGVLNIYRPAWDDYEMAVLVDSHDGADEMQGQTNPRSDFDRLPAVAVNACWRPPRRWPPVPRRQSCCSAPAPRASRTWDSSGPPPTAAAVTTSCFSLPPGGGHPGRGCL